MSGEGDPDRALESSLVRRAEEESKKVPARGVEAKPGGITGARESQEEKRGQLCLTLSRHPDEE